MCFKIGSRRRTRMNTEGLPVQAMKRKKTRRLKKRKPQDCNRSNIVETPSKKMKKQTAAPENTTQFLMDDREKFEPFNLVCSPLISPSRTPSSTCSSTCNTTSSVRGSPIDDKEFDYCSDIEEDFDQLYFEKDYNDVYDNIHAETLFDLTKQELISRYIDLEKREEELLKQVKSVTGNESIETPSITLLNGHSSDKTREQANNKHCLLSQLQELRHINSQLIQENERLRGC